MPVEAKLTIKLLCKSPRDKRKRISKPRPTELLLKLCERSIQDSSTLGREALGNKSLLGVIPVRGPLIGDGDLEA